VASAMLKKIFSDFTMAWLNVAAVVMKVFFENSYSNVIINEKQIQKMKELLSSRKGPVIFCPTHRSYVDFLVLSTVLYYYGLEVPLICSGEDFLNIPVVNQVLRGSGAFFMRRTFRGAGLYKSIFYEYVSELNKQRSIMEFFIEGTRSRFNKMSTPKYGFLSVCTKSYFEKDVEEMTIVPVTLNYSKTLEGETFPGELRGSQKVKETLGRVLSGLEVLATNLGTMVIDFCEPIQLSSYTAQKIKSIEGFDPFLNKLH
jgi:glycerol-3-phosphate O-acyltransferase